MTAVGRSVGRSVGRWMDGWMDGLLIWLLVCHSFRFLLSLLLYFSFLSAHYSRENPQLKAALQLAEVAEIRVSNTREGGRGRGRGRGRDCKEYYCITGLFFISIATFFLIVLFLSRSCGIASSIYKYKFLVLLLVSFEEQQQ